MVTGDFWVLFAMLLYFIVVVIIDFIYAKKSNRSTEEYFGRPKPRSVAHGAFRGSLRDVGLSAHGSSWSCVLLRCERSGLDGDWPGHRHLPQLEVRGETPAQYSEVAGNAITIPDFLLESFP